MVAGDHILHALRLEQPQGLAHAVEQRDRGRVGHVARGVGRQHVLQVVVHALQLGARAGLQGLQSGCTI